MVRCEQLPTIPNETINMGELVEYTVDIMHMYTECATRLDKLIEVNKTRNQ